MAKVTVEKLTYDIEFDFNDKEIEQLQKAILEIDEIMTDMGKSAKKALKSVEKDIGSLADDATRELAKMDDDFKGIEKEINDIDDELNKADIDGELKKAAKQSENLKDGLDRSSDSTQGLGDTVKGLAMFEVFKEIAGQLDIVGDKIIEFQKESFTAFKDFDRSIKFAQVTFNVTDDQMDSVRKTVQTLGATTEKNALEIANALNFIALSGLGIEETQQLLPKAIDLSIVSGQDLVTTTDLLTDSLNALQIPIKDVDKLIDSSIRTTQKSNTNLNQLFEAYLAVGSLAKDTGFEIDELQTFLGLLANKSIKGAEGGVKLRNIILSLTNPTREAADLMKELDLNVADADGNFRKFDDILQDVNSAFGDLSEAERNVALGTIFNKQDIKAINGLLSDVGGTFDSLNTEIVNSTGAASKAVAILKDSASGDLESLKSAAEGTKIGIGDATEDIFRPLINQTADLLTVFNETDSAFKEFISITSLVSAGVFKMLPIILALTVAFFLFGTTVLVVVAVIAAVIAVIVAVIFVIKNWGTIVDFLKEKLGFLIPIFQPFIDMVKELGRLIGSVLNVVFKIFLMWLDLAIPILKLMWNWFKIIAQIVGAVLVVAITVLSQALRVVIFIFQIMIDIIIDVLDFIKPLTEGIGNAIDKFGDFLSKFNIFKKEAKDIADFQAEGEITQTVNSDGSENGFLGVEPVTKNTSTVNKIDAQFAPQIEINNEGAGLSEEQLKKVMSDQQDEFFANLNNNLNVSFDI